MVRWPFVISFSMILLAVACGDDDALDAGAGDAGGDSATADVVTGDVATVDVPGQDAGADAGTDAGPYDAHVPPVDVGPLPDLPPLWPRSRGWEWVRNNDPFVSALSVRMGDDAPAADVRRYFDEFNASAVHLWQTGLPTAIEGWLAHQPGARWLTWVDRRGNSSTNNEFLGGRPRPAGLVGYQIGDEPRERDHFEELLGSFDRVAAADPAPLRVFNYTFHAEEIDAFLEESCENGNVDVFSYDHYSFRNTQFSTMMKFRNAAIACGIPFWRYLKGYVAESDDALQSESDLRWDALSGLLVGYTGHTWFLYNVRGGSAEGIPTTFFDDTQTWGANPTPRFAWAAEVNRELMVYGRAQTRLRSTGVGWYASQPIDGVHPPEGFPQWRLGAGGDPFLQSVTATGNELSGTGHQDALFGFYEDRFGDRYLMVMNPNHTQGAYPTISTTSARVTLRFDFSTEPSITQLLQLRADGELASVRVDDGVVVLDIPAAELVFLKYDTGRGFEGYR